MDAANVDLKGFTERFYHDICLGHLQPVLDTLVYLKHETDVWFEITTLLIPGRERLAERDRRDDRAGSSTIWVPTCRCTSPRFIPTFACWTSRAHRPATLTRAREIALSNGVRYAYTGNVHDGDGGSTYCHQCGQKLIGRDWYVLGDWNLTDDGCCTRCGTRCPGRFAGPPGDWGAKRQPVRLQNFIGRAS